MCNNEISFNYLDEIGTIKALFNFVCKYIQR